MFSIEYFGELRSPRDRAAVAAVGTERCTD